MKNEERYKLYYPKRKVNNKQSKYRPHIISFYQSEKMGVRIGSESTREDTVYTILEWMSDIVEEYYPQPVDVPVHVYDKEGNLASWIHTPDVLVYVKGTRPILFQVKSGTPELIPLEDIHIYRECAQYAKKEGWAFKVIYPDKMDKTLKDNIEELAGFAPEHRANTAIAEMLTEALIRNKSMTLDELASIGEPNVNRLDALPVIRHELAVRTFYTDLFQPIGPKSEIRLINENDCDLFEYLLELD